MLRPVPETLLPWALSVLGSTDSQPRLAPVAGDASSRRYFRFACDGGHYVLAHAPPATERNAEFLAVHAVLSAAGVRIPALLGADLEHGYLLLEDLGDKLLLPALDAASVDDHYRRALAVLLRIAGSDTRGAGLRRYDRALLQEELGRFRPWFVEGLLGYQPTAEEETLLQAVDERLVQNALEQPCVLVHRDYHSRNLMLLGARELAVIDFQDAVLGPVTYDLVSLLRDCYISWPPERVRGWALDYRDMLASGGLLDAVPETLFLRWFDLMGLQRHLKVLGTFARLHLRDGKSAYLDDLPLVIRYVLEVLAGYASTEPLLADLEAWFRDRLVPRIARQDWSAPS